MDPTAAQNFISSMRPRESVCISDRTIVSRTGVGIIKSGDWFDAFQRPEHQKAGSYQDTIPLPIPFGNAILYINPMTMMTVLQADPGRRGLIFGHAQLFRDVQHVTLLSPSLILLVSQPKIALAKAHTELKLQDRIQQRTWILMTLRGQLLELPQSFKDILQDPELRESADYPITFTQIPGGITQMLVASPDKKLPIYVARLNSSAEVVSVRTFQPQTVAPGQAWKVLQNCDGQLLQVVYLCFEQDVDEEYLKFDRREIQEPELPVVTLGLHLDEIAYLRDFLCVCLQDKVKVISLHKEKVTTLSLSNSSQSISLQACSPLTQLFQLRFADIDESIYQKLSNRLQITDTNQANIYQVYLDDENQCQINMLAREVLQTDELQDPNKFVETGLHLTCVNTGPVSQGQYSQEHGRVTEISSFTYHNITGLHQRLSERNSGSIPGNPEQIVQLRRVIGLYKKHARVDSVTFYKLIDSARNHEPFRIVDTDVIFSKYKRYTTFMRFMLAGGLNVISELQLLLQKRFEGKEHIDQARVAASLTEKTGDCSLEWIASSKRVGTCSLLGSLAGKAYERDLFLRIGQLCPKHFSFFSELHSQSDMEQALKNMSPALEIELNSCFKQTQRSRRSQQILWPDEDQDLITSLRESCDYMVDKDEDYCKDDVEIGFVNVDVEILDLSWFYSDRENFVAFCKKLQGLHNSVYGSEFITVMLEQNWEPLQREIIFKYFLVYLVYAISSIVYMKLALSVDDDTKDGFWMKVLCLISFALWTRQIFIEICQLKSEKAAYFIRFQNFVDLTGLLLVLFILITTGLELDFVSIEALHVIASVASCLTMIKFFDWFFLFKKTGFWALLVWQTVDDIKYFLLLLLVTLMMFGVPMVMLDMNSSEDKELVESAFGTWIFDLMYHQYMLALGMMEPENFSEHPQASLAYIFFLAATFFSQLIMMNMLVTIMGGSYNLIVDNEEVNSVKVRLQILSDMSCVLSQKDKNEKRATNLYVTRKSDQTKDDVESWEGTIRRLTRVVERQSKLIRDRFDLKVGTIQKTVDDCVYRDVLRERQLKVYIDQSLKEVRTEVRSDIKSVDQKLDLVLSKLAQGEQ